MSDQPLRFAWGHLNINVSNLERSIAFYEKLGFKILMPAIPYLGLTSGQEAKSIDASAAQALGLEPETQGRACIMQLDDGFPKLDLTEFANKTQQKPLANTDLGIVRFCLASQNLQKDYEDLRGDGVEFLSAPQSCKDRMADVATCVDPDGTLIELVQVYLERWPLLR